MYDMYGNGMRENKILGWDRIGNEEVESISVFFLLVNEDGKQKRLPTTLLIFVTTTKTKIQEFSLTRQQL